MLMLAISHSSFVTANNTTSAAWKVGDYVQFGTYNKAPIVWRVINIDSKGAPLLFSEKILSLKAFDASGNAHVDSARKLNGSNRYRFSTIRQWLNSADQSIAWIRNRPIANSMMGGNQAYDREPGFLADQNFNAWERSLILPYTHKVVLHHSDAADKQGGTSSLIFQPLIERAVQNYDVNAYYELLTDKVFLLSIKQLKDFVHNRGLDIRTQPTSQAISTSANQYPGLSVKDRWHYWLSTPNGQHPGSVRYVFFDGMVNKYFANSEVIGVRPAVQLHENVHLFSTNGNGTLTKPHLIQRNKPQQTINVVSGNLFVNAKNVKIPNHATIFKYKGQSMLPVRVLASEFGLAVTWDAKANAITLAKRGYSLKITPNSSNVTVNQKTEKKMAVPAVYSKGVLMIHARFLANELGCQIFFK
jgi:hypothetical protein